ncbi:hypothetical protein PINS_up020369 [Pythium insidiosum]|nr:hypothetical protein PINS_up020369 [Pythium insidiosum]
MGFPDLTPQHRSLMAKHLTREIYAKLKDAKTSTGYTLDRAIQTGVDNPHLGVGITAGDEESYHVFKEIFDPVIEGWHGFKPDAVHKCDMDPTHIKDGVLPDEFIVSTRIRAGRNIRGFPLPPATSRAHRKGVMNLLESALSSMPGDLAGKFYKLADMTPEEEHKLIEDHFLFQKPGGGTLLEPPAPRATGRRAVGSSTTTTRRSSSGATRRTTCVSSRWRTAATWSASLSASAAPSRTSRRASRPRAASSCTTTTTASSARARPTSARGCAPRS